MPGFFLLQPGPVFLDPNKQTVQENDTLLASGSSVFDGYGIKEVALIVNVLNAPTGTLPTLQYTIREVDPGDQTTALGTSQSGVVITAATTQIIKLPITSSGTIKVSWVITGTTPSFTGVYATLVCKAASTSLLYDANGVAITLGQKAMAASVPVVVSSDQSTLPVSVATLPLPTGAATEATLTTLATEATLATRATEATLATRATEATLATRATEATLATRLTEASFLARINTLGQKTMAASTPVVISSDQTVIPVSVAALPLPTGAATEATLSTRATEVTLATRATEATLATRATEATLATRLTEASFLARINTLGQKLMAASTPVVIASDQSTLPISAAALPLPAGAATEATLATRATEATLATRLTEASFLARINTLGQKVMAASTPVVLASDQTVIPVSDNGGSLTTDTPQLPAALVGGRLDENIGAWLGSTAPTVGQKTMAASLPVTLASDQTTLPVQQLRSATGTTSSVPSSAASVTVLASNANRRGATIYNDSTKRLFLKMGAVASATDFTVRLDADGYYEVPFGYTGIIDGIWASANGSARVTEFT